MAVPLGKLTDGVYVNGTLTPVAPAQNEVPTDVDVVRVPMESTLPLKVKSSKRKFDPAADGADIFKTTITVPVKPDIGEETFVLPVEAPAVGTVILVATVVPFITIELIVVGPEAERCLQKLNEAISQVYPVATLNERVMLDVTPLPG